MLARVCGRTSKEAVAIHASRYVLSNVLLVKVLKYKMSVENELPVGTTCKHVVIHQCGLPAGAYCSSCCFLHSGRCVDTLAPAECCYVRTRLPVFILGFSFT